jgi:hypothetical protein
MDQSEVIPVDKVRDIRKRLRLHPIAWWLREIAAIVIWVSAAGAGELQ